MQWKCQGGSVPSLCCRILHLYCILKYFNLNICKTVKHKVNKSCKNPNVFENKSKPRKLYELKNICTLTGAFCCVWLADTSSAPVSNYIPIYWEYFSFYFRTATTIQLYIVTWGNHSIHFFPLNRNKQFVFLLYISVRIVCCIFAKYRPFRSNYTGVVCSLVSVVCWWRWETGNKNKALSVVFSTLVVCMWFLHNQIYRVSGFILQPATQLVM